MFKHARDVTGNLDLDGFIDQLSQYDFVPMNYLSEEDRPNNVWMYSPYGSDGDPIDTGRHTIKLSFDQFPEMREIVERVVYKHVGRGTIKFNESNPANVNTFMVTKYLPGSFFSPHIDASFTVNGETYHGSISSNALFGWDSMGEWLAQISTGREFSLIVLLNDAFTGGTLTVSKCPLALKKGDAALFSQYVVHSLSKIETGVRYVALFRFKVLD